MCCRWSCDDSVTHYIYQGKVGDNTKEYRAVKERGLHIVSQHWLQAVGIHTHTHTPLCSWYMKFRILVRVTPCDFLWNCFRYSLNTSCMYACSFSVQRSRSECLSHSTPSPLTPKWAWCWARWQTAPRNLLPSPHLTPNSELSMMTMTTRGYGTLHLSTFYFRFF